MRLYIALGLFLVVDFFDAAGAVFKFRRMALRVQGGRRQLIAGTDPPLVGHIRSPFGYAVCFLTARDGMAPFGDDADQVAIGDAQFLAVFRVHLDVARFIG